jgi:arginosuccinate synthase-like protein
VKTTVERILCTHSAAVERFDEYRGESASIEIAFDRGVPLAINNVDMALADLIVSLATIAGAHGVTSPHALLHAARQALHNLVVATDVDRLSGTVSGTVELQLLHTGWRIVGCQSPHALDSSRAGEQLAVGNS